MTEPAPIAEGEEVEVVILDGKKWPVPPLVWQQLRKVEKPIINLSALIADEQNKGRISREKFDALPESDVQKIADVVFWSLTRAHPTLTRDEFENFSFDHESLLAAFLNCRIASGKYVRVPEGNAPPGEAAAAG